MTTNDPYVFIPADFKATADELRDGTEQVRHATLSNSFNIILAALHIAEHDCGLRVSLQTEVEENHALRRNLLWAAEGLSPALRRQLLDRLKSDDDKTYVSSDAEIGSIERERELLKLVENITDHIQSLVDGAQIDSAWISHADALANSLRGHLPPTRAAEEQAMANLRDRLTAGKR